MNGSGDHSTPYVNKQRLLLLFVVVALLMAVSGFESLGYWRPVTLQSGSHTLSIHKLPDATIAVLDSSSQLKLGEEWKANGTREVWLQGGALFTTTAARDTTGFTIHLSGFDVVAYNSTSIYCFNRKKKMYAWVKEGRAYVVTHDTKPRKSAVLPGNVIEYTQQHFFSSKKADAAAWLPAD